jgi:phosphopantothenate---cysteine ligase (ATP)
MSSTLSFQEYFATQPPPPTLEKDVKDVRDFIEKQRKEGRNVVLVTVRPLTAYSLHLYVDRFSRVVALRFL